MHIKIDNGPSKFDLMLGLFDRKQRRTVTLSLFGEEHKVKVVSVGIVDKREEFWAVEFSSPRGLYRGWYDSKTREGVLDMVK